MAVLADKHERYSIRCMTHPSFALSPGENRDRDRERNGTGRAILDIHIGSEVNQLEMRDGEKKVGEEGESVVASVGNRPLMVSCVIIETGSLYCRNYSRTGNGLFYETHERNLLVHGRHAGRQSFPYRPMKFVRDHGEYLRKRVELESHRWFVVSVKMGSSIVPRCNVSIINFSCLFSKITHHRVLFSFSIFLHRWI